MSKIIKGQKIVLRPLKKEDFSLIYKWINDPQIMPFWYGKDKPRSREWVHKHFQKILDGIDKSSCYIIELNGRPVGFMYNTPEIIDEEFSGRVELDILIGETNLWSKGYGTDALRIMINYCFKSQKAERVFINPRKSNKRAIHVYEKVGFKKEGIMRHFEFFEGKWEDSLMMAIIRDEWKSH